MIQELQIDGFRSLKSVTWKPGRLNVLIGPNGGGKSNLLRAFDLLRISANGGLQGKIRSDGGMMAIAWNSTSLIQLRFTAQGLYARNRSLQYEFSMDRVGRSGAYEISDERLVSSDGLTLLSHRPTKHKTTETALSRYRSDNERDPVLHCQSFVRQWGIYHDIRVDQEAEIRRAVVTQLEKRIEADGQNLIAVLHTLYTDDPRFEEFLDDAMTAAFPNDYEKLSFSPAEDGRVQMRVRRKHTKKKDSASDLSDGTLRFLFLLAILGASDPPPLIAIDDPEAGLHPRMLPIVGAIAADTAVKSQVMFTTHSPQLLDAFRDELPTTTVVTWNGSETEMKTISGNELKRWVADYSLGKFAFSGEAEAVL
jgi:predicted ATPase